jgi:hypothetical protein
MQSLYLAGHTLRLHYKAQPVNTVWGNSRCLLWKPYGTQIHSVGKMQKRSLFRHYATSRKVAGLIPVEVIGFFSVDLIQPHYGPGVEGRPARGADNLTAICELTV